MTDVVNRVKYPPEFFTNIVKRAVLKKNLIIEVEIIEIFSLLRTIFGILTLVII